MPNNLQQHESTIREVPVSAGRFAASGAATPVEGTDRFTMTPFAGQVFDHWYWGKMTFDADGMSMRKKVIPAFKDHDPAQLVGEIDTMSVKDGVVVLSGDFAKTKAAEEIRAVKKLDWECSLAFDLGSAVIEEVGPDAMTKVNGAKLAGPATVVRKAVLYETSFTFFGGVPGTETAFADDPKKCVSIPIFKEVPMSNLDKVQEDAKAAALGLFQKMSAMCEDKAFVAECFEKSMDLEKFHAALISKLSAEVAQLKADLETAKKTVPAPAPAGAPAVAFSAPSAAPAPKELSFVEEAHKLASEQKIPLAYAFSKVAREKPALYQKHLDACPAARR
jgi:hypothetical protein